MMRAFVALDLPEALVVPLSRLQAGLTVGRPVPAENLHLTLAFLDEVADVTVHDIAEALDALRLAPVALALSGLELLGGRRPAVLAVGAKGPGLENLHAKVMRVAREAGVALPRERFRPHVTIARFPREMGPKDQRRLGEFLALNGAFVLPETPALAVTLYRSHLTHEGAHYEPLATFPFTG
ncbi:MAG: RNA 2',3'-cyclic phosphodiesterase [Paracoccaceae bacterium]